MIWGHISDVSLNNKKNVEMSRAVVGLFLISLIASYSLRSSRRNRVNHLGGGGLSI